MKKLSISLIAFMVGILYCTSPDAQISYRKVNFNSSGNSSEQGPAVNNQVDASGTANLALSVHNLMYQLADYSKVRTALLKAQEEYELAQDRYRAMTKCQINNLVPYFKDPKQTWSNLTDKYDRDEKKLSIQINTTDATVDQLAEDVSNTGDEQNTATTETLDMSETLLMWSLGNGILHDFYENQDKYGARIDRSLPQSTDQKFVYNETVWKPKYREINLAACCRTDCGVYNGTPKTTERLADGTNYDYHNDYKYYADGKVQAAHNDYIAKVSVSPKHKDCGRDWTKLTSANMPAAPARPLPPTHETYSMVQEGYTATFSNVPGEYSVSSGNDFSASQPPFSNQVIYNGNQLNQKSSAWPAPWKTFIDSKFNVFNANGDMPFAFESGTTTKRGDLDPKESRNTINNRLNVYQLLKKDVDAKAVLLDSAKAVYVESMQKLRQNVEQVNTAIAALNAKETDANIGLLELPENFDLLNHFASGNLEQAFDSSLSFSDLGNKMIDAQNKDSESLTASLGEVFLWDGSISYVGVPPQIAGRWPEKFDVNQEKEGELVINADDEAIGRMYLKPIQLMTKNDQKGVEHVYLNKIKDENEVFDFDLVSPEQVEKIKKNFDAVKQQLIAKGWVDLKNDVNQGVVDTSKTLNSKESDGLAHLQAMMAELGVSSDVVDMGKIAETAPEAMDSSQANLSDVLKALEKDKEAIVFLTIANARKIDDLVKEQEAVRSMIDEWEGEMAKSKRDNAKFLEDDVPEISANCLNMGI